PRRLSRGREEGLRHLHLYALFPQTLSVELTNVGVLLVVEDGTAAFVDAEQVTGLDLAVAGLLLLVEDSPAAGRPAPVVDHPHGVLAGAEVLVEAVTAAWRRGYQASRHIL